MPLSAQEIDSASTLKGIRRIVLEVQEPLEKDLVGLIDTKAILNDIAARMTGEFIGGELRAGNRNSQDSATAVLTISFKKRLLMPSGAFAISVTMACRQLATLNTNPMSSVWVTTWSEEWFEVFRYDWVDMLRA